MWTRIKITVASKCNRPRCLFHLENSFKFAFLVWFWLVPVVFWHLLLPLLQLFLVLGDQQLGLSWVALEARLSEALRLQLLQLLETHVLLTADHHQEDVRVQDQVVVQLYAPEVLVA